MSIAIKGSRPLQRNLLALPDSDFAKSTVLDYHPCYALRVLYLVDRYFPSPLFDTGEKPVCLGSCPIQAQNDDNEVDFCLFCPCGC